MTYMITMIRGYSQNDIMAEKTGISSSQESHIIIEGR